LVGEDRVVLSAEILKLFLLAHLKIECPLGLRLIFFLDISLLFYLEFRFRFVLGNLPQHGPLVAFLRFLQVALSLEVFKQLVLRIVLDLEVPHLCEVLRPVSLVLVQFTSLQLRKCFVGLLLKHRYSLFLHFLLRESVRVRFLLSELLVLLQFLEVLFFSLVVDVALAGDFPLFFFLGFGQLD